jgi:hypothetical protein
MTKSKVVLREWEEESKALISHMDASKTLKEYDPHKLHSEKFPDGWALLYEKETLDSSAYLQLVIDGNEDGIYRTKDMAYDGWYNVFRDGLEKIEAGEKPKTFVLGFVIGEPFYKKVSEFALQCFKERRK